MDLDKLTNVDTSCFYLAVLDDTQFANWHMLLDRTFPDAVVRAIRDFFNEVSAAWQFPYYFGENWNAFNDCITDLEWLQGRIYLMLVRNASSLLREAAQKDFAILMRILQRTQESWKTPNRYFPRDRLPTPFHVIFQCSNGDVAQFSQRLDEVHAEYEKL
jgi:RNAse (barnase) inhibitor barstar